jgi:hypothetical protein
MPGPTSIPQVRAILDPEILAIFSEDVVDLRLAQSVVGDVVFVLADLSQRVLIDAGLDVRDDRVVEWKVETALDLLDGLQRSCVQLAQTHVVNLCARELRSRFEPALDPEPGVLEPEAADVEEVEAPLKL